MSQVTPGHDRSVGYAAKQLTQTFRAAADKALRPVGLTQPQFAVLVSLTTHPGASNSDLARKASVTRQSMTEVLTGLLAAGLISRSPHPVHRRVQQIALTPAGQDTLRRAETVMWAVEDQMTTGLTKADHQQLLRLISLCITNLDQVEN